MSLLNYVPFLGQQDNNVAEKLDLEDSKGIKSLMKVGALALGHNTFGSSIYSYGRKNFESPEGDFSRINKAIDTDAYAKQAISKYQDLFWKEGWDIVGESSEAVDYVWQRLSMMEVAMDRTFQELLIEIVDQWLKFSNVFIVKARGNIGPYFPGQLKPKQGKEPIIGYYVIPTETVEILRNKHNKPIRYRQNTSLAEIKYNATRMPSWPAEDVIHIYSDRKPGRAFGTPAIYSVFDDIIALRQMEEDVLNLIHRELFPLYVYKIGTDDKPASKDEIEKAQIELENMRTEAGLIIPNRHNIEALGGDSNMMDATAYLSHFKERVAIGLGVFPHHLGMTSNGGNRAMTDRLDSALFDKVKYKQKLFGNKIRSEMLNEILVEGGFDPYMDSRGKGKSGRCDFKFNEIDVDTQVKKESHIIQKWTANLITIDEARMEMHMKPEVDDSKTHEAKAAKYSPKTSAKTVDPKSNKAKNVIRPSNQYGKRTSPNIRRSDDNYDILEEIVDLIGEDDISGE